MATSACSEDTSATSSGGTTDGSTSTPGSSSSSGETPTTGSSSGSESATGSDTGDTSTSGATTTGEATIGTSEDTVTTSDTAITGNAPVCGEQSCQDGEVCVVPCCGGPPPACSEPDGRGKCEGGQDPVPSVECEFNRCAGPLCCPPIACQPDPPFCVASPMLSCEGTSCNIESCSGTLNGDTLECECA